MNKKKVIAYVAVLVSSAALAFASTVCGRLEQLDEDERTNDQQTTRDDQLSF